MTEAETAILELADRVKLLEQYVRILVRDNEALMRKHMGVDDYKCFINDRR